MKPDYLKYRSATSASIVGLIAQVAMAVGFLIYAVRSNDTAALTAAAAIGIGVLAWITLVIVFDQHRREREEAMEVENLAASPVSGASVFENREDFRPAAKRLAALHKWFVPLISILIGVGLIAVGLWRYTVSVDQFKPVNYIEPTNWGFGMGVGLAVAVVGFLIARYAAGMAKVEAWKLLRAGASHAVGAAILGFAIAVGQVVDYVGTNAVARAMLVAVPIFMMVVGAEIMLHFLLGVYRPRKAGEVPQPAFDSRLLGFVAAPDRIAKSISDAINYQLGFDVTGGWFYQLVRKWIGPLAALGAAILWLMTTVVVVQPHQRAMILRFGQPIRTDLPPGPHFKLPWPIDSSYVPEYFTRDDRGRANVTDRTVTGLRTIHLGTSPPANVDPILWTNDHIGAEVYQYVRASTQSSMFAGSEPLADLAMVSIEIPMQYVVKDVLLFDKLATPETRDDLLKSIAQRELTLFFQTTTLDEVLGGNRENMARALRERLQAAFDGLNPDKDGKAQGAGVDILFVGVVGLHPPKESAPAFEAPVQADARRQAVISAAQAQATEILTSVVGNSALATRLVAELDALDAMKGAPGTTAATYAEQEFKVQQLLDEAGGSAAVLLAQARSQRWTTNMSARGIAARYEGQLALFNASPELFRTRTYFEALQKGIGDSRLFIVSDKVRDARFDVDLKPRDIAGEIFEAPKN